MPELRKDYILNRYVILATERAKRPTNSVQVHGEATDKSICPFSPGNHHMLAGITSEIPITKSTSPSVVASALPWLIRVVPNLYAAVSITGNPVVRTDNEFFTFASAYGYHEVIIETPEHDKEFEDLPVEHITEILRVYQQRMHAYQDQPRIRFVSVFKNRGLIAGASISHSHTQVIAYNAMPTSMEAELERAYDYYIKNDECVFCKILAVEEKSFRHVYSDSNIVAFTPYASRFPFEIWVFSRRHISSMTELSEEELVAFAGALKKLLQRLDALNYPPFNLQIHSAKVDEQFHFHIEIAPRLATWAGFEISTETIINTMTPENAASFYRGDLNP